MNDDDADDEGKNCSNRLVEYSYYCMTTKQSALSPHNTASILQYIKSNKDNYNYLKEDIHTI